MGSEGRRNGRETKEDFIFGGPMTLKGASRRRKRRNEPSNTASVKEHVVDVEAWRGTRGQRRKRNVLETWDNGSERVRP